MLLFWSGLISYDTFTQESNDEFQHYDEKGVCALTLLRDKGTRCNDCGKRILPAAS